MKRLIFLIAIILGTSLFAVDMNGTIEIIADPGINVYLDNNFIGETNSRDHGLLIQDVPENIYVLRLEKKNCQSQKAFLEIKPNNYYTYIAKPFKHLETIPAIKEVEVKEKRSLFRKIFSFIIKPFNDIKKIFGKDTNEIEKKSVNSQEKSKGFFSKFIESLSQMPKNLFKFFSGDKSQIFFQSQYSILAMNAEGEDVKTVISGSKNNPKFAPAISPDGKKIAFYSEEHYGSGSFICISEIDGSNPQKILAKSNYNFYNPSWSPDGSRIVCEGGRQNNRGDFEIYVMNADGSDLKQLTYNSVQDRNPVWSKDGQKIIFQSGFDIRVMDYNGNNARTLLSGSENNRKVTPSVSSDGEQIVFCVYKNYGERGSIWISDIKGRRSKKILGANGYYFSNPSWSSDGSQIVCEGGKLKEDFEIFVMNADGSDLKQIIHNDVNDRHPSWIGKNPKVKKSSTGIWGKILNLVKQCYLVPVNFIIDKFDNFSFKIPFFDGEESVDDFGKRVVSSLKGLEEGKNKKFAEVFIPFDDLMNILEIGSKTDNEIKKLFSKIEKKGRKEARKGYKGEIKNRTENLVDRGGEFNIDWKEIRYFKIEKNEEKNENVGSLIIYGMNLFFIAENTLYKLEINVLENKGKFFLTGVEHFSKEGGTKEIDNKGITSFFGNIKDKVFDFFKNITRKSPKTVEESLTNNKSKDKNSPFEFLGSKGKEILSFAKSCYQVPIDFVSDKFDNVLGIFSFFGFRESTNSFGKKVFSILQKFKIRGSDKFIEEFVSYEESLQIQQLNTGRTGRPKGLMALADIRLHQNELINFYNKLWSRGRSNGIVWEDIKYKKFIFKKINEKKLPVDIWAGSLIFTHKDKTYSVTVVAALKEKKFKLLAISELEKL